MATTQISNPAAAVGASAASYDTIIEHYVSAESSTTISKGQVVSLNTSGKILQATTSVDEKLTIGVAQHDILAGQMGAVVVQGLVADVAAEGAISAGDDVARSGTTAGSVAAHTSVAASSGKILGTAVAAAANNLVLLYVSRA